MLSSKQEPIAIVGIGCRFPGGVQDPRSFWQLLIDRVDAVTEMPEDRFDLATFYDPRPATPGKVSTRFGGFLKDIDKFDPYSFGISPREATYMDPQQRLLLEIAWEAFADAGLPLSPLVGSDTGVFVGLWLSDFESRLFETPDQIDFYMTTGSGRYAGAGRLSYLFGLQGPSIAIDTACSSSLVSVHLACQSLRQGECSLALAGGANTILQPHITIAYSQSKMMAADGHCKFGDVGADGYVRSEGAGLVVLKRLTDALADGDRIYAVIQGSSVNNDGRSGDYMTTPSQSGQMDMLRRAYQNAGIQPHEVQYIEAHGTGTRAGDPVELGAIGSILSANRSADQPLYVGSVKTNLGHTEGAAGVAGLIKIALALHHQQIPASLHLAQKNPTIPWETYQLEIPCETISWPETETAVAGVSAFGIAGTNAHIVASQAPTDNSEPPLLAPTFLLPLSAQTDTALQAVAQNYHAFLMQDNAPDLAQILYTAARRQSHLEHRLALVADSKIDLQEKLAAFVNEASQAGIVTGQAAPDRQPKIAFIFPGQGSQWLGMGRELLQREPVFRDALARCEAAMQPFVDWSLQDQLQANAEDAHYRLDQIDVIQPSLLAIEIALAELWQSWGIQPDAVIGHSMGEVGAAAIAGAITLEDAMQIICRRSQLMRRTSGQGAMAVVELTVAEAEEALQGYEDSLSIAVSNSPRSTVIAGDPTTLDEVLTTLQADGVFCRKIKVDVASHSPQMTPLQPELRTFLADMQPRAGTIPIYTTSQAHITDGADMDADFWVNNLRQPVQFSAMITRLLADGITCFMEMSPHPILLPAVQQVGQQAGQETITIASLRREEPEQATMLTSLGQLFTTGYSVAWQKLYPQGQVVSLPTYPWQRERFWYTSETNKKQSGGGMGEKAAHPLLGWKLNLASAEPVWQSRLEAYQYPYLFTPPNKVSIHRSAAYIEMVLAAVNAVQPAEKIALHHLVWLPDAEDDVTYPAEHLDLQVSVLSESDSGAQCHIHGRFQSQSNWHPHLHTNFVLDTEVSDTAPVLATIQAQHQDKHSEKVEGFVHLSLGDGDCLGQFDSSALVPEKPQGFLFHPLSLAYGLHLAMMTAAASSTPTQSANLTKIETIRLGQRPFSISWGYSQKRSADNLVDVWLYNQDGTLAVEILGIHVTTQILPSLSNWFYQPQWQPSPPLAERLPTPSGSWLIFADKKGVGQALANRLQQQGSSCYLVTAGNEYKQVASDRYEIKPDELNDMQKLVTAVTTKSPDLSGIIHLWGLDTTPTNELNLDALETDQVNVIGSTLHLVQSLLQIANPSGAQVWLISHQAQSVTPDENKDIALAQAPLWGVGRTIAEENPEFKSKLLDLGKFDTPEQAATWLHAELEHADDENQIAIRVGQRYVLRLIRFQPPVESQPLPPLRSDRSYLITGGLGDIGIRLAHWLVDHGAKRLILVGRSPIPPRADWAAIDEESTAGKKIAAIRQLESRGTAVHPVTLDISNAEALQTFLTHYQAEAWPSIAGVFHAAGILENQLLQDMDIKTLFSVLSAKMSGAWLLHQLLGDLEIFVLFSSTGSLLIQPGQANYAAANSFLDALAHYRQGQNLPSLSINWGVWEGLGLVATEQAERNVQKMIEQGLYPMQARTKFNRFGTTHAP